MLIVKFNYKDYAISELALQAIKEMEEVESKQVAGITKYYVKEEEKDIPIQIVPDDRLVYPGELEVIEQDTKALLKQAEDEKARNFQWYAEEKKKADALAAEVKALKALCPDSHKKEGDF